jgi:hypothetical protein
MNETEALAFAKLVKRFRLLPDDFIVPNDVKNATALQDKTQYMDSFFKNLFDKVFSEEVKKAVFRGIIGNHAVIRKDISYGRDDPTLGIFEGTFKENVFDGKDHLVRVGLFKNGLTYFGEHQEAYGRSDFELEYFGYKNDIGHLKHGSDDIYGNFKEFKLQEGYGISSGKYGSFNGSGNFTEISDEGLVKVFQSITYSSDVESLIKEFFGKTNSPAKFTVGQEVKYDNKKCSIKKVHENTKKYDIKCDDGSEKTNVDESEISIVETITPSADTSSFLSTYGTTAALGVGAAAIGLGAYHLLKSKKKDKSKDSSSSSSSSSSSKKSNKRKRVSKNKKKKSLRNRSKAKK